MTEVTIYSSASCDWQSRNGTFFAALKTGQYAKYMGGHLSNTTADRCIITGLIEAVHLIRVPCRLTLTTAISIGLNKQGRPRGRNQELKRLLLDLIDRKHCTHTFDVWQGGGEKLKAAIEQIKVNAIHVDPIGVVETYLGEGAKSQELFINGSLDGRPPSG
ncbi:MAG: hypothetical protein AAF802_19295 [Planctomycetota bacterium]